MKIDLNGQRLSVLATAYVDGAVDTAIGWVAADGRPHIVAECFGRSDWNHEYDSVELARLFAGAAKLKDALVEATEFVERHSEPWYISGQALLAKCREALKEIPHD